MGVVEVEVLQESEMSSESLFLDDSKETDEQEEGVEIIGGG